MEAKLKALKNGTIFLFISFLMVAHLNVSAESNSNYIIQYDNARQSAAMQDQISHELRRPLEIRHRYSHVFAGFSAPMSEAEAKLVRQLPGVQRVVEDEMLVLSDVGISNNYNRDSKEAFTLNRSVSSNTARSNTDSGDPVVDLISANRVWDGSATNDGGHLGEGTIVGIIGPGLPQSHPIFASSGDDDYVHINPLGDGEYLGDCFVTPEHECNSKLIGRYNFTDNPEPVSAGLEAFSVSLVSLSAGNRLMGESVEPWGVDIVTGIAPHANVIVYRVCPGFTCPNSAVLQAIEQAIIDGVDVLINSVGGSSQNPWNSVFTPATLALRDNDIMFSQAGGNGGPSPGSLTSTLAAPWSSVFVSSTHARVPPGKQIGEFEGGNPPVPPSMLGGSISDDVSAPIVYAGNIPNPNSPDNPALCLEPYPNFMLEGVIVVCDRGEISRVQKAVNARDSGAVGFVLANVPGGSDSVNPDVYVVPGIHLNTKDSEVLRNWLNTGSDHQATISSTEATIDIGQADHIASTSGQGPVFNLNYLMPSGAVPTVDVVVASSPGLFERTNGMAAATAGGVLALLKSARPEWTGAERQSALMSTGIAPLLQNDGVSTTETFAHGGGRVDVSAAARAGLVLDETTERFVAENPLTGGQPKDLNLAGLINLNCLETCSWTRTLRATQDGTWTSTTAIDNDDIQIEVVPSTFSLVAGETQTLVVTLNRNGADVGSFDGVVTLEPDNNIDVSRTSLQLHISLFVDDDLDGLGNAQDNCINVANPFQYDFDGDDYGNLCDADLNNDGMTNFLDLSIFGDVFQSSDPVADFNVDGTVNFIDLEILKTLFLKTAWSIGANIVVSGSLNAVN